MKLTAILIIGASLAALVTCQESSRKEHGHKEEHHRQQEHQEDIFRGLDKSDHEMIMRRYADRMLDYFLNNPVTKREKECFSKAFTGDKSIEFVIDLAPSPAMDKLDDQSANSPIGQYLELFRSQRSTTRTYFDFVTKFIDLVSFDIKPELCYSVLVEKDERAEEKNVQKYFIRGRAIEGKLDSERFGGEFKDEQRKLNTLWPASTGSKPETKMSKILVNNLGRMTKLALWNRDNGLPTVLLSKRESKPVYTVIISDGASGLSIKDLTDDLSRTSVIDIGNHRFVDRLRWEDVSRLRNVFTVTSPQTLLSLSNSVRTMACWVGSASDVRGGRVREVDESL